LLPSERRDRNKPDGGHLASADRPWPGTLDSLDFLELVETLSKRTGYRIDEDDYPALTTLHDAADFLATYAP
jgi:hypothetical protein